MMGAKGMMDRPLINERMRQFVDSLTEGEYTWLSDALETASGREHIHDLMLFAGLDKVRQLAAAGGGLLFTDG